MRRSARTGTLGGGGRRRRAEIGDEIDDGPVGLVADRGDERDGACRSGAGDALVVEAPEIFEAAAAASDDDEIGARHRPRPIEPVEADDRRGNLDCAGLPLHPHRPHQHVAGEAVGEAMENVADHRTGGRGDDTDDAREIGERLLARLIEQAFGGEHLLALLEQRHECADAGGLELVDDDLIGGLAGIGGDAAAHHDFEPLLRLEFEPLEGALPDHRFDRGLIVLQGEIAMAG
jgi:hypothetical protein